LTEEIASSASCPATTSGSRRGRRTKPGIASAAAPAPSCLIASRREVMVGRNYSHPASRGRGQVTVHTRAAFDQGTAALADGRYDRSFIVIDPIDSFVLI